MSIIRVKKDTNYFTASNKPFNDKRLSWETRGLMGYLLSKPNNWQVRMDALEKAGPAGTYKLRRMLAEARKNGYINRVRITLDKGKFDWITEVYENPDLNPNPEPSYRKSTSGLPTSGKLHDIVKTDSEKNDLDDVESDVRLKRLVNLYEQNIGALTPLLADALKDAADTYLVVEWYPEAFQIAINNNARKWSYVRAVLEGWLRNGKDWKPESTQSKRSKSAVPTAPVEDNFMAELKEKHARADAIKRAESVV